MPRGSPPPPAPPPEQALVSAGAGFGGVAVAAAVVTLAVGMSQARGNQGMRGGALGGGRHAGQAQQSGEVSGIATHMLLPSGPPVS